MALYGLSGTLVLGNGENPVGLEVFQFEARAAGPLNGEGIHNVTRAQPEVLAVGAGGAEAFAALDLAVHQEVAGAEGEAGADAEAVGADAGQRDLQPVIAIAGEVAIEGVVGVVAGVVAAKLGENVEVAVVVDVGEGDAVTLVAGAGEADGGGEVGEGAVAVVVKEAVGLEARELGVAGAEVEIEVAVVIQVGDSGSHGAHGIVEAGFTGDVGKGAVAVIAEEAAGVGVERGGMVPLLQALDDRLPRGKAGGEEVGPAVVVVVEEEGDKAVVRRLGDAGLTGDVGEA